MTKEEKIKEAWVELIGVEKYNDIKDKISENGYICVIYKTPGQFGWTKILNEYYDNSNFDVNNERWLRPKSLRGIENNNGWIKIESEDDLPKEDLVYWVVKDNQIIDMEVWEISLSFHNKRNITHYQPIEKPKPPVY